MDGNAVLPAPFVKDFLIIDQILLRARAINNVDLAVAVTVVAAVIDDRVQRRKADAARDEQKILSRKRGIDREAVAVRPADGDLLSLLHAVEPLGHAAALLDGEFDERLLRGAGGDGKQRLAHAGNGEHRALAGDVLKGLFPVEADHTEGLDVRSIDADLRHDADHRDQRVFSHFSAPPNVLTTLTMFIWIGHFFRHRPQPTQPNVPS